MVILKKMKKEDWVFLLFLLLLSYLAKFFVWDSLVSLFGFQAVAKTCGCLTFLVLAIIIGGAFFLMIKKREGDLLCFPKEQKE